MDCGAAVGETRHANCLARLLPRAENRGQFEKADFALFDYAQENVRLSFGDGEAENQKNIAVDLHQATLVFISRFFF